MIPAELLEQVAERFALLSDPTRIRVLNGVHAAGEAAVGELAEQTGVPLASVSQHLNRLAAGGVVERRRSGTRALYRIADPAVVELCGLVCGGLAAGDGAAGRARSVPAT